MRRCARQIAFYGSTPAYRVVLDVHGLGRPPAAAPASSPGPATGPAWPSARPRRPARRRRRGGGAGDVAVEIARRYGTVLDRWRSTRRTPPTRTSGRRSRPTSAVSGPRRRRRRDRRPPRRRRARCPPRGRPGPMVIVVGNGTRWPGRSRSHRAIGSGSGGTSHHQAFRQSPLSQRSTVTHALPTAASSALRSRTTVRRGRARRSPRRHRATGRAEFRSRRSAEGA